MKTALFLVGTIICLSQVLASTDRADLTITYFGHSCFLIVTPRGTKIVTDPIDLWNYRMSNDFAADVVTVSHNHRDHNATDAVPGHPTILYGLNPHDAAPFHEFVPSSEAVGDVNIRNISSNHSPPSVSPQLNSIFVFEVDGVTIAHLGDLGRMLTDDQIEELGRIDVLMIPVGGRYTLSLQEADETIRRINAAIAVVPMHFRTETVDVVPNSVHDFVNGKQDVVLVHGDTYTLNPAQRDGRLKYVIWKPAVSLYDLSKSRMLQLDCRGKCRVITPLGGLLFRNGTLS